VFPSALSALRKGPGQGLRDSPGPNPGSRRPSGGLPPRLIWDVVAHCDRLPLGLRARGEFEYVGRKPLGDGFTGVPVREVRGALLRPFDGGRTSLEVNFLLPSGYSGQTLETLALPSDAEPFERIVGVPTEPYVSLTFTYYFGSPSGHRVVL